MKSLLRNRWVNVGGSIVLAVAIFFVGIYLGYNNRPAVEKVTEVFDKQPQISDTADFAPFWQAWNILNDKYIFPASTTPQNKVWGAIEGLAQSYGDPYTVFMPPQQTRDFDTQISGNFEGVGMEVGIKDNNLVVVAPLKGSPAEAAGVKAGDQILKINGTSTANINTDTAVGLIRGPKGTVVTLTLYRVGKLAPFTVSITRDTINIPTVDTKLLPNGIFVISLYSFSQDSAQLFAGALQKFIDSKSDKLILDLRGNPGGYLDAAVDMASWFLPNGKVVVREDYGGKIPEHDDLSTHYQIFNSNLKMIILVDQGTASAAEILSGALQEYGVAKLVGTQTFGKGSVQQVVKLTPDTNLKITVAHWLTPHGVWISQKGITPDYVVPIKQVDVDNSVDPQLNKAEQLLLGGK